jgi:hypothetical protein
LVEKEPVVRSELNPCSSNESSGNPSRLMQDYFSE